MAKWHTIKPGECLSSVAYATGFFYRTLWEHPKNADLKELRRQPHVLMPGDQVWLPDVTPKAHSCRTDAVHRFVRKGIPETLRLRFEQDDKPRARIPFALTIDGVTTEGETNDNGELRHPIDPLASKATLVLYPPDAPEESYPLSLRGLDPVTEVSGVQGRLRNLGLYRGVVDGLLGVATESSLRAFQSIQGLEETGRIDDATRAGLQEAHGR